MAKVPTYEDFKAGTNSCDLRDRIVARFIRVMESYSVWHTLTEAARVEICDELWDAISEEIEPIDETIGDIHSLLEKLADKMQNKEEGYHRDDDA